MPQELQDVQDYSVAVLTRYGNVLTYGGDGSKMMRAKKALRLLAKLTGETYQDCLAWLQEEVRSNEE